jgi:hypothetical protein
VTGRSEVNTSRVEDPTTPESKIVVTHVLWFYGLGTSLSSAMFAALLQSWVRRYVVMIKSQQNPRSRALTRAHVILQKSLISLQLLIDFLHLLLDQAVFAFLAGLVWLLPTTFMSAKIVLSPSTSNFAVVVIVLPLLLWYTYLTLISFCGHTIYSTPLSRVMIHLRKSYELTKGCFISFFKSLLRHRSNAFIGSDWVTLDTIDLVVDKLTDAQPLSLDKEIVTWLLRSLYHDKDFGRFLESIPGFYNSDLVKRPAEVFRPIHTDKLPCAILSYMHRTLSSATLPNEIKQKRIRLCLEVMELDPYLLECTFTHALSLPAKPSIFQCIDFILVADRFAGQANGNRNVQLLVKCILAVSISYFTTPELDERWLRIVQRWSSLPISTSDTTSGERLASMKLDTLISLVVMLNSAGPPFVDKILNNTLHASGNFAVESVSSESQTRFCTLWNKVRDWAAVVPESSTSLILPILRTIYNTLHGGLNDPPITRDLPIAAYPRCTNLTHPLNPRSTPGSRTDVAHACGAANQLSRHPRT